MKIQYLETIDEAVEVQYLAAERLGTPKKLLSLGLIGAPLPFLALYFLIPERPENVVFGCLASVVYLAYWVAVHKKKLRDRLRKTLIQIRGSDEPQQIAYELTDDGITCKQMGQTLGLAWSNVESVNHNDAGLTIWFEPLGLVLLPARAFTSHDEMMSWVGHVKSHSDG